MGKIRVKQIDTDTEDVSNDQSGIKKGKPTHPRDKHGRSKRYEKTAKAARRASRAMGSAALAAEKAIPLIKELATANFTETIEAHFNLTKKDIRKSVNLPHSTGKKTKILILTSETTPDIKRGTDSNIKIEMAGEEKIDKIKKEGSPPEVDQLWATPDIMNKVPSIASIIGPAGLMPNPKHGTIVKKDELAEKIKSFSEGKISLETEKKAPLIHTVIGKADMPAKKLQENLEAIIKTIDPKQIKTLFLSSTMGPSIRVKLGRPAV